VQEFFDRLIYMSINGDDLAHACAVSEQAMGDDAAAASYLRVDAASQTPSQESQHPAERSHIEDRVGLLRDGTRVRWPKRLKRLAAPARRNNW
jgi:hypothetical protein